MTEDYLIPMNDTKSIDFDELMKQDSTLLKILAARPDTPAIVLARLACHSSYDVMTAVARNPKTPPEVLEVLSEKLLKDRYGNVENSECAQEVTANPSTHPKVLGRIVMKGTHGHVNALKNQNTPLVSILNYMLDNIGEAEKSSLNFNTRFNDLIRLAAKLDAEHEASLKNLANLNAYDSDSNDNPVEARWG